MDGKIVLSKLLLVIFCVWYYCNFFRTYSKIIIILLLFYVFIDISHHILKNAIGNKTLHKLMPLIQIIFLFILHYTISPFFALFLPYNIIEFLSECDFKADAQIFILILSLLIIKSVIWPMYFLIASYCYMIFNIINKSSATISSLRYESGQIKEMHDNLRKKVSNIMEYDAQTTYLSKLEERNRLSQRMHDSAGHSIAGSLMQLELAKLLIDKDREKTLGIIDNVIITLRQGHEELRKTLKEAKPQKEELGINRIKLMLDKFKLNGIDVYFNSEGEIDVITFLQWKVINENTNEALTNITRYSKATRVDVSITVLNKLIKVVIKDNGVGTSSIIKGLGIRGMEERTEELSGKLITDGSDGFSVIMLLPLIEH